MFYETKEGDEELRLLFIENSIEENEDERPTSRKKSRRTEATILNEENRIEKTKSDRPRRAATSFYQKSSPIKSISPKISIDQGELCSICHRIIPDDIIDVHRRACEIQKSQTGKELVKKIQDRTKTEAKIKEILFPRTTRQSLTKSNSDTTTCSKCGMQMTVHRLENQHKNECVVNQK